MRALVQRVLSAEVRVAGEVVGAIGPGLLVYVGVAPADTAAEANKLGLKVAQMRIFEDAAGKMNLSLQDARGGILIISNFTLLADARKGRRPAFTGAAAPDRAAPLVDQFVEVLRQQGLTVATGRFGAEMHITSVADGPVNIVLDVDGSAPPADNET